MKSFQGSHDTLTAKSTIQEANKTFSRINEDLCKLETKRTADAAAKEEASLQLLREDLRVQGDTLSSAILRLCADVRSSESLQDSSNPSTEVRMVSESFRQALLCISQMLEHNFDL